MILVETATAEEWDSRTDWEALAETAVRAAVAASRHRALTAGPSRVEVSVRFGTDGEVRSLNAAWRGRDRPTNVLSFPMVEADRLDGLAEPGGVERLLGDVVLAHGVCAREAEEKGLSLAAHAAHLVVHGTLHLLGYDHETGERDAGAMEDAERSALAGLGIPNPYASEVRP